MSQQKFGVLGWPVTHSVSPQMQGAGFDSLGIDASYKLLPLDPGEFENGIRQLVADDFRGWNITVHIKLRCSRSSTRSILPPGSPRA